MTRDQLLLLLKEDVNQWNELRRQAEHKALRLLQDKQDHKALTEIVWSEEFQQLVTVDFSGADLRAANLRGAQLGWYTRLLNTLEAKGLSSGDLLELKPGMINLQKANLNKANLEAANLHGADLRAADLSEANLGKADLREAILDEANLYDVRLEDADLSRASLRNAKLINLPEWIMFHPEETVGKYKPHLQGTNLDEADFTGAKLNGLDFRGVDLSHIKQFSKAKLIKADLSNANLKNAYLREADLRGAHLTEADLSGAAINKVRYAQAYPKGGLGTLSKFASEAHEAALITGAHFTGASLADVDLSGMDLTGTILKGANLTGANLTGVNLTKKDLQYTDLSHADLSYSILVQTDLRGSNLKGCRIHGIAVWDVLLDDAQQSELLITRPEEPAITVDNLQMAQFIYLLMNRKNLRDIIDTITSKAVLILGRFTPERKAILDAMATELRKHNLLPIIFDFERSTSRDFTETIKTLAGISLFIIADITNPKSSPLELQATVPDYQIPFVAIIEEGERPFSMLSDLIGKYDWVLDTVITYPSRESLLAGFEQAILIPALKKRRELQMKKTAVLKTQSVEDFFNK